MPPNRLPTQSSPGRRATPWSRPDEAGLVENCRRMAPVLGLIRKTSPVPDDSHRLVPSNSRSEGPSTVGEDIVRVNIPVTGSTTTSLFVLPETEIQIDVPSQVMPYTPVPRFSIKLVKLNVRSVTPVAGLKRTRVC